MPALIIKEGSRSAVSLNGEGVVDRGRRVSLRDRLLRVGRSHSATRQPKALIEELEPTQSRQSLDFVDSQRAEAFARLTEKAEESKMQREIVAIDREALFAVKVLLAAQLGDRALSQHAINYIGSEQARTTTFDNQQAQDTWLALHDGIILLRYINTIYPQLRDDTTLEYSTESLQTIKSVIAFLQDTLQMPRRHLFDAVDLLEPSISGINKVLACIQHIPIPAKSPTQFHRHHKSMSTPPSRSSEEIERPPSDFTPRRNLIVVRPRHEDNATRRAQKFYGLDRRMSESAIDLPSVSEEESAVDKRADALRIRPKTSRTQSMNVPATDWHTKTPTSGQSPSFRGSTSPLSRDFANSASATNASPSRPPKSDRRHRPSHLSRSFSTPDSSRPSSPLATSPIDSELERILASPVKKRPLSATSASSIPFPASPQKNNLNLPPNTSPSRPRHNRWNSEIVPSPRKTDSQAMRRQSSGFDSSGSSSEGHPIRRSSVIPNRHRIVVKEDGRPIRTYQLGECIGRGQFGSVYRALNIDSGRVVAVKRIRLAGKSEEEISQLALEVDLLKSVSHPSIVSYEGLLRTENYLNIVLEYVENGSLLDTLKAFGDFPEPLVASYVLQILDGLQYLHQHHIVHCDLKCANILTTKSGNIKIGDFGVSLNLNTIKNNDVELLAGTPHWLAPEIIQLRGASTASDIWSLACVIVEMLTCKPPYADLMSMAALYHIVEDVDPPIPDKASPALYDFLVLCFAKNPEDRPTADTLFKHHWLVDQLKSEREQRPIDSIPFISRLSSSVKRPTLANSVLSDLPDLDYSPSSQVSSALKTPPPRHLSLEPTITDSNSGHEKEGSEPLNSPPLFSGLPQKSDHVLFAQQERAQKTHNFVKTSFGKSITCRICQRDIKRHAKSFLCEGCGLICHTTCSTFSANACDLRASLIYPTKPSDGVGRSIQAASYSSVLPSPSTSSFFDKVRPRLGPKARSAAQASGLPFAEAGYNEFTSRSDSSGSAIGSEPKSQKARVSVGVRMRSLSTDNLPLHPAPSKLQRRESNTKDENCIVS